MAQKLKTRFFIINRAGDEFLCLVSRPENLPNFSGQTLISGNLAKIRFCFSGHIINSLRPSFIRILRGLETGVVPEGKNRPPVFSERVVAREYRPGSVRPGEGGGKRRKGNGESDSDDDWVEMRSSRPQQSGDACAQLPPRFFGEG